MQLDTYMRVFSSLQAFASCAKDTPWLRPLAILAAKLGVTPRNFDM